MTPFEGFSKKTVEFFDKLKKNNNKKWFDKHKGDYDSYVLEPSRAFVTEMGERLKDISPDIFAVPKVNKSLFRIHRDIRFSPDKSPYKTHMGIFFWEGSRPRMDCSGFYCHLEPPLLMVGVGDYIIPRNLLDRYRRAVVDPEYGEELSDIVKKISKLKDCTLGGKHYKRIPAGYDPSHPNAELLLHNGLHAGFKTNIQDDFYSSRFIDYCWEKFKLLAPLHKWLVEIKIGEY